MSWLCACYRGRGPHKETEAMKRQSSDGEHEVIELPEVNGEESKADHTKPLNSQAPATSKERDQWKSCRKIVFWKCKLWMVLTTIFVVLFLVILISLALYSNVYTDEDDYWDTDSLLHNYHNFSGKFNLLCGLPYLFSEDITKRITDVYSSSPALGRYFRTAKVDYFSNETSTVYYQLEFFVPPSTEGFMEHVMNPDFIRSVLLQNIYDEEDDASNPGTSECTRLRLDPASLTSTCKYCTLEELLAKSTVIYLKGGTSFWKNVEM